MKGYGKQLVAGLIMAIFIATATYLVIYTAGFAYEDQMAVAEANTDRVNGPQATTTYIPTPTPTIFPTPFPTPIPTPTPTPVPSVRVGANFYWDLQTAYDLYSDPTGKTVIEMLEGNLPGSLDAWRPIDITIKGGFDTTYTTISGITIMQGEITLSSGSLTVEQVGIGSLP